MRLKTKHLNTEFIQTHLRGTFQGHLLIAKSLYIYCTYSLGTTRWTKIYSVQTELKLTSRSMLHCSLSWAQIVSKSTRDLIVKIPSVLKIFFSSGSSFIELKSGKMGWIWRVPELKYIRWCLKTEYSISSKIQFSFQIGNFWPDQNFFIQIYFQSSCLNRKCCRYPCQKPQSALHLKNYFKNVARKLLHIIYSI